MEDSNKKPVPRKRFTLKYMYLFIPSRADLLSSSSKDSLARELQEIQEELYVEQEASMSENVC